MNLRVQDNCVSARLVAEANMPKLRALWHAVRGATDLRRAGGTPHSVIDSLGILPGKPHVMHVRPGLLDTDLNYHMNNAAFLSQAEFAR